MSPRSFGLRIALATVAVGGVGCRSAPPTTRHEQPRPAPTRPEAEPGAAVASAPGEQPPPDQPAPDEQAPDEQAPAGSSGSVPAGYLKHRPEFGRLWVPAWVPGEIQLERFPDGTRIRGVILEPPGESKRSWRVMLRASNEGTTPTGVEVEFQDAGGERLGLTRRTLEPTSRGMTIGWSERGPSEDAPVARVVVRPIDASRGALAPAAPPAWELRAAPDLELALVAHGEETTYPEFTVRNDGPDIPALRCKVELLGADGHFLKARFLTVGPIARGATVVVGGPEVLALPYHDGPIWKVRLSAHLPPPAPARPFVRQARPALEATLPDLEELEVALQEPRSGDEPWRIALEFENPGRPVTVLARYLGAGGATVFEGRHQLPSTPAGTVFGRTLFGPDAGVVVERVVLRQVR